MVVDVRRAGALASLPIGVIVLLTACGAVAEPVTGGSPPPSATAYVVAELPTTTVPPTEPPPPTDASGAVVTTTTLPTEYVVRVNDSVYRIAARFGLEPERLAEINGWSDGVSHTILPGDTILIAPPATSVPGSSSVPATTGECPTTYTIQPGDTTRVKVAEQFGITFEEMDAANVDTPGYRSFVVGTPITIPCPR